MQDEILFPKLLITSDNTLFMSYLCSYHDYNAVVLKYNGVDWEMVGSPVSDLDSSRVFGLDFAIDSEDNLWVSYVEPIRKPIMKITTKKYNPLTQMWDIINEFEDVDILGLVLRIDMNDNIYLAISQDTTPGVTRQIIIRRYNKITSKWETLGDYIGTVIQGGDFLIDEQGNLFLIILELVSETENYMECFKYNDGLNAWERLGSIWQPPLPIQTINLHKNNDGLFFTCGRLFEERGEAKSGISVVKYSTVDEHWDFVGEEDLISEGSGNRPHLNSYNNILYCMFNNTTTRPGSLTVKRFDSVTWETHGQERNTSDNVNFISSVFISEEEKYIGFLDFSVEQRPSVMTFGKFYPPPKPEK